MRWTGIHFRGLVFFGGLVLAFCEIFLEVHVPGTDVFLFKEAGVNLATKGKFVASYLPHMVFGDERPFAYYPPLYPFVFGVWSWIVGIGLKQSLFFDSLLSILRTLLMIELIIPAIPQSFFQKGNRWMKWGMGLFFTLLTLLSTDRDRPDELALIWGLLLCLTLTSQKPIKLKITLSGLFLACVGATSPACGVLFAMIVGAWSLTQERKLKSLFGIGGGALLFWLLLISPILLHDLSSGIRFSKQAGVSSFPYLRYLGPSPTLSALVSSWAYYAKLFWSGGVQYVCGALAASFLAIFLCVQNRFAVGKMPKVFLGCSSLFAVMVPLVWTLQPYYLWFAFILLMVGIFQLALGSGKKTQALVLISFYLVLTPFWIWEAKCLLNAVEVPKAESSQEIRKRVLAEVGPQAKLAISHDQYFTFRPQKEIVNMDYWADEVNQFDFLYLTDLPDSRRQLSRSKQLLTEKNKACFELVKDFSTYTPIRLLGYKTAYFVRGNGGSLYRNVCKLNL